MINREDIVVFLKGFAMGAANVVPGVSGGTIAFITGIYERLIEALKAFDLEALKMIFDLKIAAFCKKTDLRFLIALGLGVVTSVASLAHVLKWGFKEHPVLIWALFFGLILASVPSLIRMVKVWRVGSVGCLLTGLAVAIAMAFLKPASENPHIFYLLLCGTAAMCSMIIPGLSGSFVLLLMGNYELVMLDSVNALTALNLGKSLPVLIPVGIGAVIGLLVLARVLSWLFKNHHDKAVAAIAGFVAGSLVIIWPWKDKMAQIFQIDGVTKEKIIGYQNWHLPDLAHANNWLAILFMLIGAGLIVILERLAKR